MCYTTRLSIPCEMSKNIRKRTKTGIHPRRLRLPLPPAGRAYFEQSSPRLCRPPACQVSIEINWVNSLLRALGRSTGCIFRCQILHSSRFGVQSSIHSGGETDPRSTASSKFTIVGASSIVWFPRDPQGGFAALFAFALRDVYDALIPGTGTLVLIM